MLSADCVEPWWRGIEPVNLRENVTGDPPAQATRVSTLWNESGWRLLFEMDDADAWATLTRHDGPLWTEEVVEIFVDPVGDLESYFEVEINPLGTVADLALRRSASGWRKEFGWHVDGLLTATRRTSAGWAAEFVIPFESITDGLPPPGQSWRVNFLRIDRPQGAGTEAILSAWSPTGVRNFHRPEFFGTLELIGA